MFSGAQQHRDDREVHLIDQSSSKVLADGGHATSAETSESETSIHEARHRRRPQGSRSPERDRRRIRRARRPKLWIRSRDIDTTPLFDAPM
jgi:hypothetical protein